MNTRIIRVPVKELLRLEVNARFLRHEQFQRLVKNVRDDGALTSVPFGAPAGTANALTGEDPARLGRWEVLSGNHRVDAAEAAGLTEVDIMVTDEDLPRNRRLAIQLSHNAIAGEDDPAVLAALYQAIDEVDLRLYSGLDDKGLHLLTEAPVEPLAEAALDWTTISLVFLPDEAKRAREVLAEAKQLLQGNELWALRAAQYDPLMDALTDAALSMDVKNQATAFLLILDIFEAHRTDADTWFERETGDARKSQRQWVPLSLIFGSDAVPPKTAALLKRTVERLVGSGQVPADRPWEALEALAAEPAKVLA